MNYHADDIIIACSSSTASNAAIGIIRISGKNLDLITRQISQLPGPIEPRFMYHSRLVLQGQFLDDICFCLFRAPHSYTGENVLELYVHGNVINIERIIQRLVDQFALRIADPGEFTYRALKNNKLSLTQVEGLDLLLSSQSTFAYDQGLSLLSGGLNESYQKLYQSFLRHKSSLELKIDFSEDIGDEAASHYIHSSFEEFKGHLSSLHKRTRSLDLGLQRPEIVLVGLPNSGKSTLFNSLLSSDRSIVSPIAGTTRDYISEVISIEGVRYSLIDTAGIRSSSDTIEQEGIKRSFGKLSTSFYSILLINPFNNLEDLGDLLSRQFDSIFFTHADQPGFSDRVSMIRALYPQLGSIGATNLLSHFHEFEKLLTRDINKKYRDVTSMSPILLDRHKFEINRAYAISVTYEEILNREDDLAILSHELNSLGHCISQLIGIVSPDEVLNSIFSNFCIGK